MIIRISERTQGCYYVLNFLFSSLFYITSLIVLICFVLFVYIIYIYINVFFLFHLGASFVPQTQFLSVNVSHGSDRPSSPVHSSPYSAVSSTTSPAGSDKAKNPNNVCTQCTKSFSSSSALIKHKLTHSDERKFVCPICSRGFKRQDHL